MKTQTQSTEPMQHLADKLKDHRVAMLTLPEDGVGLSSRPMTPLEMDADGCIWIMSSKKTLQPMFGAVTASGTGPVPANLAFVDHGSSDYVSINGHAELVEDAARKQALWTPTGRPWFSGPTDPDLTLIKITPQQAEVWDGPDSSAVRALALVASIAAGREIGLGHKETIEPPAAR